MDGSDVSLEGGKEPFPRSRDSSSGSGVTPKGGKEAFPRSRVTPDRSNFTLEGGKEAFPPSKKTTDGDVVTPEGVEERCDPIDEVPEGYGVSPPAFPEASSGEAGFLESLRSACSEERGVGLHRAQPRRSGCAEPILISCGSTAAKNPLAARDSKL